MPLPLKSAALNGRLMPPSFDTSSSGNVALPSLSVADLSTSANSLAFAVVSSTFLVSSPAPSTAASAALLRSLIPPPANPSAPPKPAVMMHSTRTFVRPDFWAATNSSLISILIAVGSMRIGAACGPIAPYGFDASTRCATAACGAEANGGAGTRLGLGTPSEGFGMPAGGGMEPAAGELTVFFPRRDFRSILGFLSSIGARHHAGIITEKELLARLATGRHTSGLHRRRQASNQA